MSSLNQKYYLKTNRFSICNVQKLINKDLDYQKEENNLKKELKTLLPFVPCEQIDKEIRMERNARLLSESFNPASLNESQFNKKSERDSIISEMD